MGFLYTILRQPSLKHCVGGWKMAKKNPLKNEFQGRCLISSIHIFVDQGFSAFFVKYAFFS